MHSSNTSNTSNSLDKLNRTELYQICYRAGHNPPPSSTREQLMAYLLGELEVPEGYLHPIDSWRHGIIGFLHDHWATLEPQLKCPAKNLRHPTNPDPLPCFKCLDAQVIACVTKNTARVEQLIQLHRPKSKE